MELQGFGRLGRKPFGALLGALVAVAVCSWSASAQVVINSATLTANDNAAIGGGANDSVTFINSTGAVPTLNATGTFATDRAMILTNTGEIEVDAGQALTLNGSVSGAGALRVDGDGTLVLNGVNTYGGNTEIMGAGVVEVTAANNLGAAANDIVFTSEGGTLLITGAGFVDATRNILLNANGTIDVDSGSVTFTQAIQNNGGSLTKEGDGTLVLTANSAFNGGTILAGGAITVTELAAGGNLGNGALTFADSGGGTPVLNINNTTTSADTLDVNLTSDGAINVAVGKVATLRGDVTGAGQLQVVGAGTLVLGDTTNNYSGGTLIESGTLQVAAGGSLGSGAVDFAVAGTGVLALSDSTTVTNAITLSGDGTLSTASGESGTYSGVVSGSGALEIAGGGTTVLANAANSFTGGIDIVDGTLSVSNAGALGAVAGTIEFNAGALQTATLSIGDGLNIQQALTLTSAGTIDVSAGGTATVSGQVSGAAVLNIDGAGTVVLANATNNFTGGVSIVSGALSVANGAALSSGDISFSAAGVDSATLAITDTATVSNGFSLGSDGSVTVSAGETATLSGLITGGAGNLLTLNGAGTTILSNAGNSFAGGVAIESGTLQIADLAALGTANSVAISNGGILNLSAPGTLAGPLNLTVAAGQTGTLSGAGLVGAGNLIVDGPGTLVLSSSNGGLAGGVVLVDGTLSIADSAALGSGAVEFAGVGGDVPTLEMTATMTVANDIVLTSSGELSATAGVTATMTGLVSGAGGLVIGGAGTVVLGNAANSFNGGVTVSAGTLEIAALGVLGSAIAVDFTGSGTLNTSGVVAVGVGETLSLSAGVGETGTVNGSGFSGAGSLTIGGGGTVDLSVAANTLAMSITNGTLQAADAAALGSGTISFDAAGADVATLSLTDTTSVANALTLNSDGVVSTAASEVATISGLVSGGAGNTLTIAGGGTAVLTNSANTFVGGVSIIDGTLQVSNDGQLGVGGGIDFNAGATDRATLAVDTAAADFSSARDISSSGAEPGQIDVLGSGLATFSGNVTGAGALDIAGTGDAVLSGAISNTGGLSVSSDGEVTISGLMNGAGGLNIGGDGTTTLTNAANTFVGDVTLSDGTLAVSDDGQLGAAANDIVFNAAVGQSTTLAVDGTVPFTSARDINLGAVVGGDARVLVTGSATHNGTLIGVNDLMKSGAGTLTLTGDNSATFTGGFTITAGTLEVTQVGALGGSGQGVTFAGAGAELAFTLGAGSFTSDEDFLLQDSATITSNATTLQLAGGVSASGSAVLTLSGTSDYLLGGVFSGPIGLNLAAGVVTFIGNLGDLSTISGVLSGSGFTLDTDGTLRLEGANTFIGDVQILSGTLDIRSAGGLGAAENDIDFVTGGTLNFGTTLTAGNDMQLGAIASASITVESGKTATLNGVISGAGALTLGGAGTVVLGGALKQRSAHADAILGQPVLDLRSGRARIIFAVWQRACLEIEVAPIRNAKPLQALVVHEEHGIAAKLRRFHQRLPHQPGNLEGPRSFVRHLQQDCVAHLQAKVLCRQPLDANRIAGGPAAGFKRNHVIGLLRVIAARDNVAAAPLRSLLHFVAHRNLIAKVNAFNPRQLGKLLRVGQPHRMLQKHVDVRRLRLAMRLIHAINQLVAHAKDTAHCKHACGHAGDHQHRARLLVPQIKP